MNQPTERTCEDIIHRILPCYDLGTILSTEVYEGGRRRAAKWVVQSSKGRFLLKRRWAARQRLVRTRLAHAVQNKLYECQYPLAVLIPTRSEGETLLVSDKYMYELFRWVDGSRCNGSGTAVINAGAQLAHLHGGVDSLPIISGLSSGGFHDSDHVRQRLKKLGHQTKAGNKTPWRDCVNQLMVRYNDASVQVNQLGFETWPVGINHGDWHPGNLIFKGAEVVAVLDFDALQITPTVADVANGLLQFSLVAGDPKPAFWPAACDHRRLLHFWNGYCQVLPLTDEQIAAIPDLMVETLIAEAVLPIAATGIFDQPHGLDFLQMIQRKVGWLVSHRHVLVEALQSIQRGHGGSFTTSKAAS